MKNKPILLLIAILFSALTGYAQADQSLIYSETINNDDMYDKLSIIASDALEGRETGERGQKMAAAFIQYNFEKMGLIGPVKDSENPYFQNVPLVTSKPGDVWLRVKGKDLKNFEDILYLGNASLDYKDKEVILAGNGQDADYEAVDVNGKSVIIYLGEGTRRGVSNKAYENGAEFVLLVPAGNDDDFRNYIGRMSRFARGGGLSLDLPNREASKGAVFISSAIASDILGTSDDKIQKALASEDKNQLKKIPTGKFTFNSEMVTEKITSENVLGFLEGTDKKEELIIITAHYDHIGRNGDQINNGADDDGSGTTSVIEIAEAFVAAKKNGNGPRRSILFMTVTGEEKGLLGSQYYTANPVFPLKNTVVNLNIDMVGRVDPKHVENPDYVYLVGSDRLSSELHEISEKVNETFSQLDLDYTYNDENHPERIYYRSDHWNFAKNNVPIIFYFNGTHEDYHRPTDTIDKINFDMLVKRARLVYHTAWVLSNRDERLVVDKVQETTIDTR
ncbi:MAG TPA: M28 family peptidase [Cyclobacteriaceae bacterium]|jgi:hypothetical protein